MENQEESVNDARVVVLTILCTILTVAVLLMAFSGDRPKKESAPIIRSAPTYHFDPFARKPEPLQFPDSILIRTNNPFRNMRNQGCDPYFHH